MILMEVKKFDKTGKKEIKLYRTFCGHLLTKDESEIIEALLEIGKQTQICHDPASVPHN